MTAAHRDDSTPDLWRIEVICDRVVVERYICDGRAQAHKTLRELLRIFPLDTFGICFWRL